jgi:hypothetical protein
MRAKLKEIKEEMRRRRHQPIPEEENFLSRPRSCAVYRRGFNSLASDFPFRSNLVASDGVG